MRIKVGVLTVAFATIFLISVSVQSRPAGPQKAVSLSNSSTIDNTTFLNANNILMFVTNHGNFGRDLAGVFGNSYGTYYPYTSISEIISGTNTTSVLYAGGLWIGGSVNGEVRMAVSEYGSEYVPGPMSGGTYQSDRPDFKVYKLYSDSLASNPNADYSNWPVDQGAPTKIDGSPMMLGDQMTWTVFNDADPNQHSNDAGDTPPLGVEVRMTSWTASGIGAIDNIVVTRYIMHNRGTNTINDMYISLWADPDLGGAADDLVGCDTVNQIWYCYNATNNDVQYGSTPPAIGYLLLSGPVVPSPGDTAHFAGNLFPDYRNVPLASFNRYVNGIDPNNAFESYNYMKGLNADGSPYTYMGNPTRFVHSGDPVTRVGDLDANPADRRMMASFGPFSFLPGDSQQVEVAMGVGAGGDRLSSITVLKFYLESLTYDSPCCINTRGNANGDLNDQIDITDLVYTVLYLFANGPPPPCPEEADVNADGNTDIGDIAYLANYMFRNGPPPLPCP